MPNGWFIYNENEVRAFSRHHSDPKPHTMWLRHYGNWLELSWMRPRLGGVDVWQVDKELLIAERKLDYWWKMAGFDRDEAMRGAMRLKAQWGIPELKDRWLRNYMPKG